MHRPQEGLINIKRFTLRLCPEQHSSVNLTGRVNRNKNIIGFGAAIWFAPIEKRYPLILIIAFLLTMNFSNLYRTEFINRLGSQTFDLLVIGGGITGCGIALDAALRGMKVALVEKDDFASGTSSRSTKLIHGGLRYLKQLEFKLVYDVGREREIVHRNARHLVIPEKMLLPITEDGSLGKYSASLGLKLYDFLAGVRKEEQRKMFDKHETLRMEPLLNNKKLIGSGLYVEYRTDDARLVIELAKSAFQHGALLLNYAECQHLTYDDVGKITGARILDKINGKELIVDAMTVVNACGPWVDLLRKEDNSLKGKRLLLTKGVHLVFPHGKLPVQHSLYFDAGDGRMIFAIPRGEITYAGTTDTVYNGDIDHPACNKEDAEYILNAVNRMFPSAALKMEDIESSWAGLRPLIFEDGKSASEVSRKDELIISDSGLISIAGGKLTGYRLMAKKAVDEVAKKSGKKFAACKTHDFHLTGSDFKGQDELATYIKETEFREADNIPVSKIREWTGRYGTNTDKVLENVARLEGEKISRDELYNLAELLYCLEYEMVYSPSDFFIRRTGKLFFERPNTMGHIRPAVRFISEQFNWDEAREMQMLQAIEGEFSSAVSFPNVKA